MNTDAFFYENPVFRLEEYAAWKKKHGSSSEAAIHSSIRYYLKEGRLINVRRGLYAVVPPNSNAENAVVDSYLVAAKASDDSILAYHTALELHGSAYSIFGKFTFLTGKKIKAFYFQDQLFQPASIPTPFHAKNDIGITTVDRQGITIRITSMERTFVDALSRIELCGGLEEVARSLESIGVLDVNAVIQYTLQLKNSVLAAKVGYFLEKREGAFSVDKDKLKPLFSLKPKSPQYLDTHQKKPCRYIKEWNLMVPEKLMSRTFEEPNYDV
jgi:predicted transcriptional regulator of viral defense system